MEANTTTKKRNTFKKEHHYTDRNKNVEMKDVPKWTSLYVQIATETEQRKTKAMTTTDKKMKQRKISKQKKKDRKQSFRFLRQWVSEKEFFFFLFQLQKTFLLHLPVRRTNAINAKDISRYTWSKKKRKELWNYFLGRRKKNRQDRKKIFYFSLQCITVFSKRKKASD